MKYSISLYVLILLAFGSCSNTADKNNVPINTVMDSVYLEQDTVEQMEARDLNNEFDSLATELNFHPAQSYLYEKNKSITLRNQISIELGSISEIAVLNQALDSVGHQFTHVLLNNLIPHWYGTPWDFEGHTSVPNQGQIACGYFVSTTLRDMGLNLNRYKLAQQNPRNEANSIAIDTSNMNVYNESQFLDTINSLTKGLYFVGLDNHVGFLYLHKKNSYFIHSNYIDGKVMIEEVETSEAFYSSTYYISNITYNKDLMEHWVKQKEIHIYKK